jgi:hypothetical protein
MAIYLHMSQFIEHSLLLIVRTLQSFDPASKLLMLHLLDRSTAFMILRSSLEFPQDFKLGL